MLSWTENGSLRFAPYTELVDANTRCSTPPVPASLEHVEKADEVRVRVGVGVPDRMADSGLGREVDDPPRARACKERGHGVAVGYVDLLEGEAGDIVDPGEPGALLEIDVVVVAEVVDTGYRITARGEPAAEDRPDESRRPGDEDRHLAPESPTRRPPDARVDVAKGIPEREARGRGRRRAPEVGGSWPASNMSRRSEAQPRHAPGKIVARGPRLKATRGGRISIPSSIPARGNERRIRCHRKS